LTVATIPDGDFLLIVDASAYFHRAFHTATRTLRRGDHQETGAIISFCWSLMKLYRLNKTLLGRRPSHSVIVMDVRSKNWRHEIYVDYKAQRPEYDPALDSQLPFIPAIAQAFNVPCVQIEGWEADDVVATYAHMAEKAGLNVIIASSDKDFCQLVSPRVMMYDAMKDKDPERFDNTMAIIGIDQVKEKWGVFPWNFLDLQAIMGDNIDNIPGVPSLGPKKAAALLKEFGTIEDMIDAADFGEVERFKNEKEMRLILDNIEELRISKRLAELSREVPVPFTLDQLRLRDAHPRVLKEFFMSIEAPQLERRVDF